MLLLFYCENKTEKEKSRCHLLIRLFLCATRGPGPHGRSQRGRRELLAPGRGAGSGAGQALPVSGRLPRLGQAAQPPL